MERYNKYIPKNGGTILENKTLDFLLEELKKQIYEITGADFVQEINSMINASYHLDQFTEKKPLTHGYEVNVVVY